MPARAGRTGTGDDPARGREDIAAARREAGRPAARAGTTGERRHRGADDRTTDGPRKGKHRRQAKTGTNRQGPGRRTGEGPRGQGPRRQAKRAPLGRWAHSLPQINRSTCMRRGWPAPREGRARSPRGSLAAAQTQKPRLHRSRVSRESTNGDTPLARARARSGRADARASVLAAVPANSYSCLDCSLTTISS